uniref:Uncharacterized protein n=1 Tax=Panagrellus redivivus TaxID=6233 RepID=A0A7E4VUZ7_PANRE
MASGDNSLQKELHESRKKIAKMERERISFGEMYRELLNDFTQLYQLYKKNVGKEPFVSDVDDESIPSGYSTSKSSVDEYQNPKADYYQDEDASRHRPERVATPEYFTAGETEPTKQQLRKREVLLQRCEQRLAAIKEASIQRALVAKAIMKRSTAQLMTNNDYFDDYELRLLIEKERAISAFPMSEIRRATAERLIDFGVYDKDIENRLAQERKAVSAFVANYASEHHRQKVLRNFNYIAPIKRPGRY